MIQNGTAVNFAFATAAGITTASITGILLQEAGYGLQSERVLVKNAQGKRTTSIHEDEFETLRLRYIISGTNLAAAKTNATLRQPGLFVVITACDDIPGLVQSNWEVISGELTGSNNAPKEVTLQLERAALITAAAT